MPILEMVYLVKEKPFAAIAMQPFYNIKRAVVGEPEIVKRHIKRLVKFLWMLL